MNNKEKIYSFEKIPKLKDALKQISIKEINLTSDDYCGWNKVYEAWFKCKRCNNTNITQDYKYCPDCGVKINFKI